MNKKINSSLIILISLLIFPALTGLNPVRADEQYTANILYTIPWGDELGTLDCRWRNQPPPSGDGDEVMWAAGHWVISDAGELIILDHGESTDLLKFAPNGTLSAYTDMESVGFRFWPDDFAVATTGEVLLGWNRDLKLLSSSLEVILSDVLPDPQAEVFQIYPSDHGSFWVIYRLWGRLRNYWIVDYSTDGNMSTPQLLFEGIDFNDCDPCNPYFSVAPDGTTYRQYTDIYNFTYYISNDEYGNHLSKKSPDCEVVYTHSLSSDPSWTEYEILSDSFNYSVTWSGDFYTLHATDDGAVLTYYELNLPPVCSVFVITPMPYQGPSPAAIEFDASHSAELNEGDTLTYEWDFDGDRNFGEPGDDDYTGDPDNPTHEYTSDYDGPVHLRVTDNHGAFSICFVHIIIDIV